MHELTKEQVATFTRWAMTVLAALGLAGYKFGGLLMALLFDN